MHHRPVLAALCAAMLFAACGGGGTGSTPAVDDTDGQSEPEAAEVSLDLPNVNSGFDRVCTTQEGFADAAAYDGSADGPHPFVPFVQSDDSDDFFVNSAELPSGWLAANDDDFDDNSELVVTELVACAGIVERVPTGLSCELELDDVGVVSLEVVNVVYAMKVYEAQTGVLVGEERIEAVDTDCPSFTFYEEGDTEFFAKIDRSDIINAVKPFVVPNGVVADPSELPQSTRDFSRICDTGIGFGGATPLSTGPGPRPMIIFHESDSGLFSESVADLPAGWGIESDSDVENNDELQPTELVACNRIVERVATGLVCEVEDDAGVVTELEMIDLVFELTVYEATTAAVVGTEAMTTVWDGCPSFVFVSEGDTEYTDFPSEDEYITVVAPYVTPA